MTTTEEIMEEMSGKTIKTMAIRKLHSVDDEHTILIEMIDGSRYRFYATYGSYTGKSEDEYPAFACVLKGWEDEN